MSTESSSGGAPSSSGLEYESANSKKKPDKVSYFSLPNKKALAILCLARLVDPLTNSSIQSYLFYQLKFFDPSALDSTISFRAGVVISAKTIAQVCTGMFWGRVADSDLAGRKTTLVIGLFSSCIASVGYGFSTSFGSAVAFQVFGGLMSSNVAIVRCVMAELNPEKRYRVRALMLMPLCANAAGLLGPLAGGLLSLAPGHHGLHNYPYVLPNVFIASVAFISAVGVLLGVPETLESLQHRPTRTLPQRTGAWLRSLLASWRSKGEQPYTPLPNDDALLSHDNSVSGRSQGYGTIDKNLNSKPAAKHDQGALKTYKLPFRKMWTFNVICTLLAHFVIAGHLGTFQALWAVFLSTPNNSPSPLSLVSRSSTQHLPFVFNGGLGLPAREVGFAIALLGVFGVVLQMIVYPRANDRFGALTVWQYSLFVFPIAYIVAPYPSLVASSTSNLPESARTALLWLTTSAVSLFFTLGRSGVTPATTLLINECTPHPSVRGTIHTSATMVGNLARSIFPLVAFAIFAKGLKIGVVGLGFWSLAVLAIVACGASRWVREGSNGNDLGPFPGPSTDVVNKNDTKNATSQNESQCSGSGAQNASQT